MERPYRGQQYRLRAGAPMPMGHGRLVLHTFGAEIYNVDYYAATDSIVGSESFRGQGGNLVSASYSRLPDSSGNLFQGKIVYSPSFVDEDAI